MEPDYDRAHDGERAEDDALVAAARAGDATALDRLIARHQGRVLRFGLRMCKDPDDAADIVQETLLALARSIKTFRGDASLSTWLYGVARSFCIKKRRRRKDEPAGFERIDDGAASEATAVPSAERLPDEEVAGQELRDVLERALERLDPMYRDVIVLRDVEGLTAPEVAQVLDLTVEAVKSRLHRARAQVRATLAPYLAPGGAAPAAALGCPDVVELWSHKLEGEISADVCSQMEAHLATCPRCTGLCDSLRQTLALCRAAPEPQVPVAIQESIRAAVKRALGGA